MTNNDNGDPDVSTKGGGGTGQQGQGGLIPDVTVTAATTTTCPGSVQNSAGEDGGEGPREALLQSQSAPLHLAEVHSHTTAEDSGSNVDPGRTLEIRESSDSGDVNNAFDDGEAYNASNDIDDEEQVLVKNFAKNGQIPKNVVSKTCKETDHTSGDNSSNVKQTGVSNNAFNGDESMDKITSPLNASSNSSSTESVMSVTSGSSAMENVDKNGNDGDVPTALPTGKKGMYLTRLFYYYFSEVKTCILSQRSLKVDDFIEFPLKS